MYRVFDASRSQSIHRLELSLRKGTEAHIKSEPAQVREAKAIKPASIPQSPGAGKNMSAVK
jgi:hypothetical protein